MYYYSFDYGGDDGDFGSVTICNERSFSHEEWHRIVQQAWAQMAPNAKDGEKVALDMARYICALPALGFQMARPLYTVRIEDYQGLENMAFPSLQEFHRDPSRVLFIERKYWKDP